jgi:acyl-CoA thioester hydrolase
MHELGAAWMIHIQHVEYKNQAFLGEEIRGTTWVAAYGKVASSRRCRFERISDGKIIFESETQWVLVDVKRGRPMAISDEMKKLYVGH